MPVLCRETLACTARWRDSMTLILAQCSFLCYAGASKSAMPLPIGSPRPLAYTILRVPEPQWILLDGARPEQRGLFLGVVLRRVTVRLKGCSPRCGSHR